MPPINFRNAILQQFSKLELEDTMRFPKTTIDLRPTCLIIDILVPAIIPRQKNLIQELRHIFEFVFELHSK